MPVDEPGASGGSVPKADFGPLARKVREAVDRLGAQHFHGSCKRLPPLPVRRPRVFLLEREVLSGGSDSPLRTALEFAKQLPAHRLDAPMPGESVPRKRARFAPS